MVICKICNQPLPPDWPAGIHFHDSCKLCHYCNGEVGTDIIEKLIHEQIAHLRAEASEPSNETESPEGFKFEIYHPYCKQQKLEADFKNKPVIITQEHLDMLNSVNLMFRPNLDLSVETNQKEAELLANRYVHQMSLEEKFITLKRMEAVAAMWSIALSKDKSRIQTKLAELDRIKFKDLQNSDERIEIEKERIQKRERETLKLSPAARAEKKAIDAMTALGMTHDDAVHMMEAQKAKRVQ